MQRKGVTSFYLLMLFPIWLTLQSNLSTVRGDGLLHLIRECETPAEPFHDRSRLPEQLLSIKSSRPDITGSFLFSCVPLLLAVSLLIATERAG